MARFCNGLIFFAFLAGFACLGYRNSRRWRAGDDRSIAVQADEVFSQLVRLNEDERYSFNGAKAQVVLHEEESLHDNDSYTFRVTRVQRYARNSFGEYFYFVFDGSGPPFLKYVRQPVARLVLKDRYIPPDSD